MTTSVSIKSLTIKAKWTREMSFDISSYRNINYEEELANILRDEFRKIRIKNRKFRISNIFI